MKRKKTSVVITVLLVAVIAAGAAGTLGFKQYYNKPAEKVVSLGESRKLNSYIMPVSLIAHRGFSGLAPENTLSAVKAAAAADFYGTEFDIRLTSDGQWVVLHNDDVSAMTNGEGLVSQMTLEQVRALKIDAGANVSQHPDERIPTLEEVLDTCTQYKIMPVVEIKLESGQSPDYAALARTLREKGHGDCVILSFDMQALLDLKAQLPTAEYWLLAGKVTTSLIRQCADNGLDGIDFNASQVANWKYIDSISEADLVVAAWTVDNIHLFDELYRRGVYYITTNMIYPV